MDTQSAARVHRPDADLRRTAPSIGPARVRRPLQPAPAAPVPPAATARPRRPERSGQRSAELAGSAAESARRRDQRVLPGSVADLVNPQVTRHATGFEAVQGILRARNRSGDGGRLSPLLAVHQAAAGGRTRPHMHDVRAFGWVLDKVAPTCPCRQTRGRALPAPQRKFDYSWAEEASPSLASPTSSSASRLRAGRETATGARWPGRRSPPARSRRPGRTASRSARAFQRRGPPPAPP